jgi:hypothetical protein
MVAPWPREPLLLYITTTPRTASTVLITERDAQEIAEEKIDAPRLGAPHEEGASLPVTPHEESPSPSSTPEPLLQSNPPEPPEEAASANVTKVQKPVYFISIVLCDA